MPLENNFKVDVPLYVTALLSGGPGRPWKFVWTVGLPGAGLEFHLWWCKKQGMGAQGLEETLNVAIPPAGIPGSS